MFKRIHTSTNETEFTLFSKSENRMVRTSLKVKNKPKAGHPSMHSCVQTQFNIVNAGDVPKDYTMWEVRLDGSQ